MDIKQLKEEVRKYIAAMEADGKKFSFVALIPTFPGVSDTPYTLQVFGDWIEHTYIKKVFDYMIPKMFEVLELPARQCIFNIETYKKNGSEFCNSEDLILVNEIKYNPNQLLHA